MLALGCFESTDADGNNYEFLSILCFGTDFRALCLLEDTRNNRTAEVRKFYEFCWTTCAGQPEEALFVFALGLLSYARGNISKRTMGREGREQVVIVDRARSSLAVLTDYRHFRFQHWRVTGTLVRQDGVWISMLTRV